MAVPLRADGFGLVFLVAMVIAFINLVRKAQQSAQGQRGRLDEMERRRREASAAGRHPPAGPPRAAASRSAMLEELQRRLEQMGAAPGGVVAARKKPGLPPARPAVLDLDLEAQDVVQRRIDEAESRNQAISDADYAAFEKKIRQKPVAPPLAPVEPLVQEGLGDLQRAVVWNELLGLPVGLRGTSGPRGPVS